MSSNAVLISSINGDDEGTAVCELIDWLINQSIKSTVTQLRSTGMHHTELTIDERMALGRWAHYLTRQHGKAAYNGEVVMDTVGSAWVL